MSADGIRIEVEGEQAGGRDRRTAEQINAEADEWAAKAAQYRRETAYWRQQSAQSVRDNLEMTSSRLASEQEAAEGQLREGLDYGDANKVIEAQRALSNIEARQRQNAYALHQANTRPPPPVDPVERYVQGRSERAASWLRSHSEYVTNPQKNLKLSAAHSDALAEGHAPDSDAYMRHIERFVGVKNGDDAMSPGARQQMERSSSNKVTLHLSKEDHARLRETAESLNLPFNVYLKRYVEARTNPQWADRLD
jgi:hypothetical protein